MLDQNSKLIRKILISYAITFMVINLADSLTMVVDGLIISRGLGSVALASTGLADPSYKMASLITGVLSAGLQALCAQAMGCGDKKKANEVFSCGMIVTIAVAVLYTSICFIFTNPLCSLFGAPEESELHEYLYMYLRGWFTGIPGYIIFFVLSPLVALDGNKKNVTAATIAQSVVNIVGDILAVNVLDTGTYGVGFSTGLSYNIAACVLVLNFFRKQSVFKLFSAKPDFASLPKTLQIGMPRITYQCCKIIAPLLINRTIIAIGGSIAMSAFSVKFSIFSFCIIIGNGISEGVGVMTQILHSEKDAISIKNTVKTGVGLMLTIGTAFSALLFIFADFVAGFYLTSDAEAKIVSVHIIRYLSLSLIFNGFNSMVLRYLQAIRRMSQVHALTIVHRLISPVLFTFVLGKMFGTEGLFIAIPVSEIAALIGYILFAIITNKKNEFLDAILMISDGYGYNSENSCSFSISSIEEAVNISEKIMTFCNQHNVDKRIGYFSALCMEELATNVIEHGFTKDNKKHHCDIRVMLDSDEVMLRIRDDCPYFNIRERYDSLVDRDIESGVGIRLVFGIAENVQYINIFNTNTLIIRISNNQAMV